MEQKRILILGGAGMLGHVLFRHLSETGDYDVYATVRNEDEVSRYFTPALVDKIYSGIEADRFHTIMDVIEEVRPSVIINCIGIIKQLPIADDPLPVITVNAQLPHRIALAIQGHDIRMVHFSTDCVFDGTQGMYREEDSPTPRDLYGRTKLLGEVCYPHCVTLRTSIIGHELKGRYGLLEWFLAQSGRVRGYRKAIYSGFPTIEMARIIACHVLPQPDLSGIYHVSSAPICKYELLMLVAETYGRKISIEPCDDMTQDRSLNSDVFRARTGYIPPDWPELVHAMHRDYETNREYYRNR